MDIQGADDFREILRTCDPNDIGLIKSVLDAHDVSYQLHGGHLASIFPSAQPTRLLVKKSQEELARDLLRPIIEGKDGAAEDVAAVPLRSYRGIFIGLVTGGIIGFMVAQLFVPLKRSPSGDLNGDGKDDVWYISNNGMAEVRYDQNHDGKIDVWEYEDPPGHIVRSESDLDFDGRVDYWVWFKNGASASYHFDNDGDGLKDEWGLLSSSNNPLERNWSFRNDEIIDKRALYRHGRKIKELYDRNRDGRFDEAHVLDEFENVTEIKRE